MSFRDATRKEKRSSEEFGTDLINYKLVRPRDNLTKKIGRIFSGSANFVAGEGTSHESNFDQIPQEFPESSKGATSLTRSRTSRALLSLCLLSGLFFANEWRTTIGFASRQVVFSPRGEGGHICDSTDTRQSKIHSDPTALFLHLDALCRRLDESHMRGVRVQVLRDKSQRTQSGK